MCTVTGKKQIEWRNKKTSRIFYGMAYNTFKHGFLIFRMYLDMLIDLVFSFIWDGTRQALPDLERRHAILAKSAVELASMIRDQKLKSEHLITICIERIKQVNPIINAVTDERFEDALKEARDIDVMIQNGLTDDYFNSKPFLGVPFTTKESNAVCGMLNTLGLSVRRHVRAHEDSESVRLMRAAGAIPIAVTNVPEVNKWQETRNMVFGQTNNPYHTGRTVGGSSGGEAALMAAIATPISLCSDIGGSTRMPAFYNGLYALNPTAGYTNLRGLALRTGEAPTMAAAGFVARHLRDLAPLTAVLLDARRPRLQLDAAAAAAAQLDVENFKIYYMETARDLRVSPVYKDLREAMSIAIKKLSEEVDSPPVAYDHEALQHMFVLWKHAMTRERDPPFSFAEILTNCNGQANVLVELPKKLLGLSQYTLAAILKLADDQLFPKVNEEWADSLIKDLKEDLTERLRGAVLLCPSAPRAAPHHYSPLLRPFDFAYWGIWNVLGFPAVQVPLGLNSSGVPLGLQVVAGPRADARCLAAAARLRRLCAGPAPPCRVLQ